MAGTFGRICILSCIVSILLVGMPEAGAAAANPHNTSKCLLCHQDTPRFGVDTRETVTFRGGKTSDDPSLCVFCHKPEENLHPILVEPGPDMLAKEKPSLLPLGESGDLKGKVVCTTCHFFHAAESDHALLRGLPGSQRPRFFSTWQDFCRDCHGRELAKRSPHAGDERACIFCHQTTPVEGEPLKITSQGADLCNFCHGVIQDKHFTGASPFEGEVACFTCHDPHLGREKAARLKPAYVEAAVDEVTINPHFSQILCFTCHRESEGYPLRTDDPVEICDRCHASGKIVGTPHPVKAIPESITPPADWPVQEGKLTCLTCHLAGHPEEKGLANFLRGGPYADRNDFCENCHDPKAYENVNPHEAINEGKGCELCHAVRPVPGEDNIDTVKFIAEPNVLCLRHHEPPPHPASFDHTMTLEAERAKTIPKELPVYKGSNIICATCHNPHVEEVEGHKLRGGGGMMICGLCHKF